MDNNIASTFTDQQIEYLIELQHGSQYNWLDVLLTQRRYAGTPVVETIVSLYRKDEYTILGAVKAIKDTLGVSLIEAKSLFDTELSKS